jgi:INO80 complex subunit C
MSRRGRKSNFSYEEQPSGGALQSASTASSGAPAQQQLNAEADSSNQQAPPPKMSYYFEGGSFPFKSNDWVEAIWRRRKTGKSRRGPAKTLKQIIALENFPYAPVDAPTYVSVDAPPSLLPAKKYSDISGFPARYTDPRTLVRYASVDEFESVQSLAEHSVRELLGCRNAAPMLK